MWNVQEEEERDFLFGAASEQQNALAWNRMNQKPDDSFRINTALKAGKFVIVEEGTTYCPSTDAIMGSRKLLIGSYDSREAAEHALSEHYDPDLDPDINVYVLPYQPTPPTNYVPLSDDDLPF